MEASSDPLAAAERALGEARWEDARGLFEDAVAQNRSPQALDGLSRAAWWMGRTADAVEAREEAYRGYRAQGDIAGSVRAALWLSQEYEAMEGRGAGSTGWLERASSLLEEMPPSVEHGWLALAEAGRSEAPARTEERSRTALEWGRAADDIDLEVRALARLGLALGYAGRIDDAFRLVDEAMVAATGEDSVSLETIGETFCDGFALMEATGDSQRLAQWSDIMTRFMRRHQYGPLVAFCGTCCGELFVGSGDLEGAERELTTAVDRLARTSSRARCAHPAAKLAELRLVQGRVEEATRLLDDYRGLTEMARVEARLALGAGRPDLAIALLRRRLDDIGEDGPRSVPYLLTLVDAHLQEEDLEAARSTVARLESVARSSGLVKVEAEALSAQGRIALAENDPGATTILERALNLFDTLGRALDAGRVRLLIARSVETRNPELAAAEARAALAAFERVGARRDADAAAALLRGLGDGSAPGPRSTTRLTRREEEVLSFLGDGLTNAEIGRRLFISAKTVDHHVSRILTKLGVRNRVQAGAYAVRREGRNG